jgi:NitT/TauT family transport system permease protein
MSRSPRERAVSIASPLVFLLLWEVAARTGLLDRRILPPPSDVVVTIVDLFRTANLAGETGATIVRFLVGLVVGYVPGVFLGLTMGLFSPARAVLNPLVAVFYPVPRIALFPLVLILVGLNETSNIIMIALGPFFTMIITAMGAAMNVEPIYREVARNFNARPRDLYLRVTLPAVAPALMDGLRLSVGLALLGAVSVEFLVADNGLGHLIWNSWQLLSLKQSMAGLVVASIVGFAAYSALGLLERIVVPWHAPASFK